MSDRFRELLDAYWSAAYDQGVSQASHDDENRTAENAERAVLEFVDGLTAALADAREKALAYAEFSVTSKLNVDDSPEYTQGVLDAIAAIRALKEKP